MVIGDNLWDNGPDQDLELTCRAFLGGSKSHAIPHEYFIVNSVKVLKWFILEVAFVTMKYESKPWINEF